MSEALQIPPTTNNPNLENSIPELTLPRVQWFTPKPFYIDVNVEEPDLEDVVVTSEYPPFFPIITEIGTPIFDEDGKYESRTVTTKLHMVQGYVHSYGLTEEGAKMKSTPVGNMPSESSKIDVTDGTKCWVMATENSSGDLVDPVFGFGEDWPNDLDPPEENTISFAGHRVWKICEIVDIAEEEDELPNLMVVKHRTGIIEHFRNGGGGDATKHPFKVTSNGPSLSEEAPFDPVPAVWTYSVYTGIAGGITIATTNLTVNDQYFIYVKLTRDTYSRVVTAAVLESASVIPTSGELYQYVAIAQVDAGEVTQHRFEDIRLTEFLISDAGELKLISVFDTTNTYDLP